MPDSLSTIHFNDYLGIREESPLSSYEPASFKLSTDSISAPFIPSVERRSTNPQSFEVLFFSLLLGFFIVTEVFRRNSSIFSLLLNVLLYEKKRATLFITSPKNDSRNKFLLCVHTSIVLSVFTLGYFKKELGLLDISSSKTIILLICYALSYLLFIFIKRILFTGIGNIFFEKESITLWLESYTSLICFSGIILFFPVLGLTFIQPVSNFCFYFIILYLILLLVFIVIKVFLLFFRHIDLLLYLFLYLCALEIIPLFFLYKSLELLSKAVVNNTLWI